MNKASKLFYNLRIFKTDIILVTAPAWDISQPPVGAAYLCGFLKSKHFRVKCLDFNIELYQLLKDKELWDLNNPDLFIDKQKFNDFSKGLDSFIDRCVQNILFFNPGVVGFSLYMSTLNFSSLLAERIKQLNSKILIVGGGPECKRLGEDYLKESPFDIFILGEAEHSLANLMNCVKKKLSLRRVPGVLIKENGDVFFSGKEQKIEDVSSLPFPDYSNFDIEKYTQCILPISMSRGCINSCTFCADTYIWGAYRFRKAESVFFEMKRMLKNYKHNKFVFVDSTFNGNIGEVEKLCDLIITAKMNITWSAKVIPRKEMTFDLLKKMRLAGCDYLAYGVESGSQRVLDNMKKRVDLEDVKRVIKDTYLAGINACCFLIVGYPTETENDFKKTLNFIKENHKYVHSFNQVTGCHIESNSFLGKNMAKYDVVFKEDGWHSPNSTPVIRKRRLERVKRLLQKCYPKIDVQVQP
ncbi:MAG: B12-binding domain-containing radical SAM protein [Nanoarchaeota archaeon]|nr:B12-binding domain-containing radical SAM protein [Nanoarchaeota archaeon]MBU1269035.1 B12-binding domain-containing radical SAM protein [Nanoarchaeota archaeon]MBU1604067.1 B12-binding domain-containing radical SAM protein [Nanoarchaeota archaeon]MBU2442735.1 B12-binding domain-containing radical SAM protein [Nanoarchaeota archaeon]